MTSDNSIAEMIEQVQTGHATTEELRVAMAGYLMRSFWPHHTDEERILEAVDFLRRSRGAEVIECWAGHCIHYWRPDIQRIKAAVLVRNCPCGSRSARTPNELPKKPWGGKHGRSRPAAKRR